MTYILLGFSHDGNIRHFRFQGVADDRSRLEVTVDADLSKVRQHGIATQDLPLLCRRLLESRSQLPVLTSVVFSEAEMCVLEQARRVAMEEAALKRGRSRVPSPARQQQPTAR